MSHVSVLLVHKDKDYYDVLHRNGRTDDYGFGPVSVDPFGYDGLVEESDTMKVKDALENGVITMDGEYNDCPFYEIIQEDETLYCGDYYDSDPTQRSREEAMAMLNPEYYCTVFDGHL